MAEAAEVVAELEVAPGWIRPRWASAPLVVLAVALALGLSAAPVAAQSQPQNAEAMSAALRAAAGRGERWFLLPYTSPYLAANAEGRNGEVRLGIALPREATACLDSPKACPIVVYLPGFGSAPHAYGPDSNPVMRRVDQAVDSGQLPSMLVVVVDGRTRLGGACYVDSPTTGQWTRFLTEDLLPTLQKATGLRRAVLAGHSMGGYGALHVSLRSPGTFGGTVALSPLLRAAILTDRLMPVVRRVVAKHGPRTIENALNNWGSLTFSEKLLWALLAAWTPDPARTGGVPQPFREEGQQLELDPTVLAQAQAFDLPKRLAAMPPKQVRALGRVFVGLGSRDGLTPFEHLADLRDAWRRAHGNPANLRTRLHSGNHTSELAEDLVLGLRFVLKRLPDPEHVK